MPNKNAYTWEKGYGVINHRADSLGNIKTWLESTGKEGEATGYREYLFAADRLANAAMWLVAHMTYARRVRLNGDRLGAEDFKADPQGHMGGSLNVAIAYVGYLLANALSGQTRGWILGQGHCVSAIEAVNVLTGDISRTQRGRYDRSEVGLNRLVNDFYSYKITPDGTPAVPLGSHVNAHTAGGFSEGGYLGFTSLQYPHIPLVGERLVAFLSDGAFEEQRGSNWAPRWWRAEDCGVSVPVMLLNGRRIEQRTEIARRGGAEWLEADLKQCGFDPIVIDGHDPIAYAWGILEAERRLEVFEANEGSYPAKLPYLIAECEKGFGFPGAGTNASHNLPLVNNPATNAAARKAFNQGAEALFVPEDVLTEAVETFDCHQSQGRSKESENDIVARHSVQLSLPAPNWSSVEAASTVVPMSALDDWFVDLVDQNPDVRVRVGNPDELASNRMGRTLARLKHRVNSVDDPQTEDVLGCVITALNEEAVISAALGNKGGLNLAVSYEAFAVKMLGALRQEIIFARHQKEIGIRPSWISVPLLLSSHTWENAKNEQSHQDPTLPEALLGEMSDTSRVLFPVDANTAISSSEEVFDSYGSIGALVVPKKRLPVLMDGEKARIAARNGAVHIVGAPATSQMQFVVIGAYQCAEALKAHARLEEHGIQSCVTALIEPGKYRNGRDEIERSFAFDDREVASMFPVGLPRVLLTHTRPEAMLGCLRRIDGGPQNTVALGYKNRGGTLDVFGMLFANQCTWAHALNAVGYVIDLPGELLTEAETAAVAGLGDPECLRAPV